MSCCTVLLHGLKRCLFHSTLLTLRRLNCLSVLGNEAGAVSNLCSLLLLHTGKVAALYGWELGVSYCTEGQARSLAAAVCRPESQTESERFCPNPVSVALPSLLGTLRASV